MIVLCAPTSGAASADASWDRPSGCAPSTDRTKPGHFSRCVRAIDSCAQPGCAVQTSSASATISQLSRRAPGSPMLIALAHLTSPIIAGGNSHSAIRFNCGFMNCGFTNCGFTNCGFMNCGFMGRSAARARPFRATKRALEGKSDPGSRIPMVLRRLAEENETAPCLPRKSAETIRHVAVVAEDDRARTQFLGNRLIFAILVVAAVVAVVDEDVDLVLERFQRRYRIAVDDLADPDIWPPEQHAGVPADLRAPVAARVALGGIAHERGADDAAADAGVDAGLDDDTWLLETDHGVPADAAPEEEADVLGIGELGRDARQVRGEIGVVVELAEDAFHLPRRLPGQGRDQSREMLAIEIGEIVVEIRELGILRSPRADEIERRLVVPHGHRRAHLGPAQPIAPPFGRHHGGAEQCLDGLRDEGAKRVHGSRQQARHAPAQDRWRASHVRTVAYPERNASGSA